MDWTEIKKLAIRRYLEQKLPQEYLDRLKVECRQVDVQGAGEFWVDVQKESRKFPENKNGLVLLFLLGATDVDPIKAGLKHRWERQPDVPDIDSDYLPEARDKVKAYLTKKYGSNRVCSVGAWQSYQLRLAIQDVARALGKDVNAAMKAVKDLPDNFDEVEREDVLQDLLSPDPEYKELAIYYRTEEGKQIVDYAFRMVGLLKAHTRHAAGLIISSVDLFDEIPMIRQKGKEGKEGENLWVSQWTEGYSPQLSKFGLVKWDVLGLKTMFYIHRATQLAQQNGKDLQLPKCEVCGGTGRNKEAVPEDYGDRCLDCSGSGLCWERIDYALKDVLQLAQELRTESVFQFETDLAKSILQKGGVRSFNDLLIYTSLGRPGPLPLVDEYIKRRDDSRQSWRQEEHPKVAELFKDTFGLIVFQEDLQRYWTEICGFTVPEAEAARKAVAKKWGEKLEKVMKKAEEGATKRIGREEAAKWNERIKTFGRYAFNKCLSGDTVLEDPLTGETTTIESLCENPRSFHLLSLRNGRFAPDAIVGVHFNGERPVFEVTFETGAKCRVTSGHKFLNEFGVFETLKDLLISGHAIKHMGGGVIYDHLQKAQSGRRTTSCEPLQRGEVLCRNNSDGGKVLLRQHSNQNCPKTRRPKTISDNAQKHGRSLLFRADRQTREGVLAGFFDSGRICASETPLCESAVTRERSRDGGIVRSRLAGIKQDHGLSQETCAWQGGTPSQAGSSQFQARWRSGEAWGGAREDRAGGYSHHPVFEPSSTRAGGWRRFDHHQWQRISDDQVGVSTSLHKALQRRYCSGMSSPQEQDHGILRNDALRHLVGSRTMQENSCFPLRGGDEGSSEEGSCGTCHIKGVRFVGFARVYSPQVQSPEHNYVLRPAAGQPVHKNSHGMAYTIISYMCLYLKARFPAEWWAAVLTLCHRDKMPTYVGIARSEGMKFASLHCDHLTKDFGTKDDVINPGLLGIKGLGEKSIAPLLQNVDQTYESVEHFLRLNGDHKNVMERLIKLGAFDHLNPNRAALWAWYLYSRKDRDFKQWLLRKVIPEEELKRKREELVERYRQEHLNKPVPKKVAEWAPKLEYDFTQLSELVPQWDLSKIIEFERQFYGYFFSSPLDCFEVDGHRIDDAPETGVIECVVQDNELRKTKKTGLQYLQLRVTDGLRTARLTVWDMSQVLDMNDVAPGCGIRAEVTWDEKFGNFSVRRGTRIVPLQKRSA